MDWMTSVDVSKLVGCNPHKAREIIKQINSEFIEQGYIVPNPYKVPKSKLYARLGITEEK